MVLLFTCLICLVFYFIYLRCIVCVTGGFVVFAVAWFGSCYFGLLGWVRVGLIVYLGVCFGWLIVFDLLCGWCGLVCYLGCLVLRGVAVSLLVWICGVADLLVEFLSWVC